MTLERLELLLDLIVKYFKIKEEVLAIGLCGSYARGEARPDSDVDLSIIVEDKDIFRKLNWHREMDFSMIMEEFSSYKDQEYGNVWSRHVFLKNGMEIEFSFADPDWASTQPLDEGTRKVVSDGFKILYDPFGLLSILISAVNP